MQFIEALLSILGLPIPGRGNDGIDRAERTGCAVASFIVDIAVVGILLARLLQYAWNL